jgi:hypothetical protein
MKDVDQAVTGATLMAAWLFLFAASALIWAPGTNGTNKSIGEFLMIGCAYFYGYCHAHALPWVDKLMRRFR